MSIKLSKRAGHRATMLLGLLLQAAPFTPSLAAPMASLMTGHNPNGPTMAATVKAKAARLARAWRQAGNAPSLETPKLLSGTVLSSTLTIAQPGSVPSLKFTFKTGSAGLSEVYFDFTAPNGVDYIVAPYEQGPRSTKGTVSFSAATFYPPFYSQPGTWTMTSALIVDNSGNYNTYDQGQLAKIFPTPSLTIINNGPVDYTPPVAISGQVLTPTVSLSSPLPQFAASITATDNVSGVALVFVFINPPGGGSGQANEQTVAIPSQSGSFDAYSDIEPGQPTGTWTIAGYELCDVALNCLADTNAVDVEKLFGTTTFTVTK